MLLKIFISLLFTLNLLHAISLNTMRNEPRVALIIANSDYDSSPLPHAVSDADALNQMLIAQGFKTLFIDDVSKRDIIKALRKFESMMQVNGIALFYYQGQMVQYQSKNYLVPLDSFIEKERYIVRETMALTDITSKMEQANNRLNILIVDGIANETITAQKGYAPIRLKKGDIYLNTFPNILLNTPTNFTKNLMEMLTQKGISKVAITKGVRQLQKSAKAPKPFLSTTKIPFYFNLPQSLISPDKRAWIEAKRIHTIAAYEHFLVQYPHTSYKNKAQEEMAQLRVTALTDKEDETISTSESNTTQEETIQ